MEDNIEDHYQNSSQIQKLKQKIVLPGDYIGKDYIAGHGTYENPLDKQIYASMAGVLHQIDRVICVKPLRQGYRPDIGDVVVGRIVQVDQKRWMVDINSYQHAILNLTSINLPGEIQRRRSEQDQLNMRTFFQEGDIISAEVMQVNSSDGKISLQTRNLKYGKLVNGFLLKIDSNFVRRMKNHIIELNIEKNNKKFTPGLIIGTNGYIWVYQPGVKTAQQIGNIGQAIYQDLNRKIGRDEREALAILRNAIVCLESQQLPIFKETIEKILQTFMENNLEVSQMLSNNETKELLCQTAHDMISKEIEQNNKQFDVKKMMEEFENQEFIDFSLQ